MKRFIKTIIIFILALFVIDIILQKFLSANRPPDYKKFINSKKEILALDSVDILVLGDCVVSDAIDSRILQEKIGLKTFNLGVYLSSPMEHYYLLKNVLKNLETAPSTLLLGTSPFIFYYHLQEGKYTPIIMDNFLLKSKLMLNSKNKNFLGLFFQSIYEKDLFRYYINNKILKKEYSPQREIVESCNGYLEFYDNRIKVKNQYTSDDIWLPAKIKKNNQQVYYFKKIIELAKEKGIQTFIISVPEYPKWDKFYTARMEYIDYKKTINNILSEYNIEMYKYSNQDMEIEDFMNEQHLNSNGAIKFTKDLSNWLNAMPLSH